MEKVMKSSGITPIKPLDGNEVNQDASTSATVANNAVKNTEGKIEFIISIILCYIYFVHKCM